MDPATVPVSGRLRHRILPRTLLGISSLILALAVGAAFSGVVLYSYYQYRLDQTNARVNTLINGYKQQFDNAKGDLKASAAAAQQQIQAQLGPLRQLEAEPAALSNLVKQLAPSLFFVRTLDQSGQPSVGSAFVISSNANQSLLLTSYTTVAAATHSPAPDVFVRQGTTETKVTVRSWDPQYDLALIVLPKGGLPAIAAAPSSPPLQIGTRLYALSGLGSAGAAITQGAVSDVSTSGVAHDAPIGTAFQGGPLVNAAGQVIGVSSRSYAPLGFSTDTVWYSPYVQAACTKVLSCPNGSLSASSG
ncbi:MAG: serine protease [Actinomycetota bacterium]|nr:serine protease [Actinomycetota bacterium]